MQSQVKTYCIIGDPVHHSLSPAMHNAAFNSLHLNCTYIAFRVPKGQLEESINALRAIDIAGFNVTLPHKVDIMGFMNYLDSSAEKATAVNTVHNVDGILKGYNTDIFGFIEPLRKRNVNFNGMNILLLGAGGSARAVIAGFSEMKGINKITIANRTLEKARQLAKKGTDLGLECQVTEIDNIKDIAVKSHLIVNTTSIGMDEEKEESLIGYEHISKNTIVYDIVYKPVVTNLLENARYAGADVVYGYEMLLEQGARAFEIWTDLRAPRDVMKKSLLGDFRGPV
ncbi:MAG TPA: shikimate dehydrogenase [Nitrososphaeraceae archaeon]|jgi:shikimate dehydrogenase|nr:shikimate dehydrogenase [Nitrososphaeraceae archaeon]